MQIETGKIILGRGGKPFNDVVEGELVEVSLGPHILRMLDGMSVASMGDYRKAGRLADKIEDANGTAELTEDETATLKTVIEAAGAMRVDLRRSMEYLLWPDDLSSDEKGKIASWYGEVE